MDVPVSLSVSGHVVVASGTVVLPTEQDDLSFKIADLNFRLKFIRKDGEEQGVEASAGKDKLLTLNFINFLNPLGTAFTTVVGTLGGRDLSLSVFIHGIPSKKRPRLVSYTFMLSGGE